LKAIVCKRSKGWGKVTIVMRYVEDNSNYRAVVVLLRLTSVFDLAGEEVRGKTCFARPFT
jgi:hypothetical protein